MTKAPAIAALFVSYNSGEYLSRALHSLWAQRIEGEPAQFEVVIVDNNSPMRDRDRPVLEGLQRDFGVKLVWNDVNSGYAAGMNMALSHTTAPIVLAANPDMVFTEGAIEALVKALLGDDRAAFVGPRGYLDEGKTLVLPVNQLPSLDDEMERFRGRFRQSVALTYSLRCAREMWRLNRSRDPLSIGMLSGACLMARRELLQSHGFFDARYPLFYEDSDLCRRYGSLGYKNLYIPNASIVHFVSRSVASAPRDDDPMKRWAIARERYFREWFGPQGLALVKRLDRAVMRFPRLAGKSAHVCQTLGSVNSPPRFDFSRPVEEGLVQVGLDSGFYLCASAEVSGSSWVLPKECWPFFSTGAPVFVRALDPADWSVLGAWTFVGVTR